MFFMAKKSIQVFKGSRKCVLCLQLHVVGIFCGFIQTHVCGSTNEWNPFITKPINGIYRLFIVNFSLVGLGAFKLKYLLRRGDGSEACLALPASRCPRHHHEREASHTAWRTDKHLGRKSNYMTVCERYISHRKINFS